MKVGLTEADLERLMCDPSPEVRAGTVGKIASHFGSGEFSDSERRLAEEIFRILARDVEVRVREALSVHLKECPQIPHDIALSLAKDVDRWRFPSSSFRRFSPTTTWSRSSTPRMPPSRPPSPGARLATAQNHPGQMVPIYQDPL